MDDLISRQKAVVHLEKRLIETAINNIGLIAPCDRIFEDIAENRIGPWLNELTSAQPERKRGKWVFYEDRAPAWDVGGVKTWARAYKCSECGFVHSVIEDFGQYAFCPHCGADMREGE